MDEARLDGKDTEVIDDMISVMINLSILYTYYNL